MRPFKHVLRKVWSYPAFVFQGSSGKRGGARRRPARSKNDESGKLIELIHQAIQNDEFWATLDVHAVLSD
eukprot:7732813-Pyramimonas_sp.AAC.1